MAEYTTDIVVMCVCFGVAIAAFAVAKLIGRNAEEGIRELENTLTELREVLGDDDPDVQDLQKQLDELRDLL